MTNRILSISGLRGIVGDGLDPVYVSEFAAAVGTWAQGGPVVVARDGRATGGMIKHAVTSALMATGCHVLDADISTTPTCGVLVQSTSARAGLQITASHNPVEWNGLKPFSPDGSVFNAELGRELLAILDSKQFGYADWANVGTIKTIQDPAAEHIRRVLDLVDPAAIRNRGFKVVLDCNHGAGAVATPGFLEQLGCEVVVLGATPDGNFEHAPEPLAENLVDLCEAVRVHKADIGFAQDPDADRLAIVDNNGRYIGEELTLGLAADRVLQKRKGPIVVNGSTSRLTADLAQKYGVAFHRSWVGEAHVCALMRDVGAVLGGEGNGGVIEPEVGYVRDSFVAMAYALDGMACRHDQLSDWVDELPVYAIVKNKLACPRDQVDSACEALRGLYPDAQCLEGDGLRLDWSDRWVQVRASNTEPILRVISEAPTSATANRLCQEAMEAIRSAVS